MMCDFYTRVLASPWSTNVASSVSSGSLKTNGVVIVPCSIQTLASLARSYNSDLIVCAAGDRLKRWTGEPLVDE